MNIQADNIIDRDYIARTERLIRPHVRRTAIMEVDASNFRCVRVSVPSATGSMTLCLRRR